MISMPYSYSLTLVLCIVFLCAGCSSQKPHTLDPFGLADEADPNDLLDEPVNARTAGGSGSRSATVDQPQLVLPLPAAETSKTIDGDFSDWDMRKARSFGGAKQVVTGEAFLDGDKD